MRAKTTKVTKAAISASRKYPEKYVWYFRNGNNECFVIGGNSAEALHNAGFANFSGITEHRMYLNGRKLGK